MKNYFLTVEASGIIHIKTMDGLPRLKSLQDAVGGWLEAVPYFETLDPNDFHGSPELRSRLEDDGAVGPIRCFAYCNEEGKLHNLPVNMAATALWRQAQKRAGTFLGDVLVGDVVILFGNPEWVAEL